MNVRSSGSSMYPEQEMLMSSKRRSSFTCGRKGGGWGGVRRGVEGSRGRGVEGVYDRRREYSKRY